MPRLPFKTARRACPQRGMRRDRQVENLINSETMEALGALTLDCCPGSRGGWGWGGGGQCDENGAGCTTTRKDASTKVFANANAASER